jgi:predicted negative regulator of RcsB-dependent stress response
MSQSTSFSTDPMAWFQARQRQVLIVGGSILGIGLVGGFLWWSQVRKEAFASNELEQARSAAEAPGGMGQAAGMLQQIIERYSGTDAAQEAVLTLAQVRMVNGQHQLAATALEEFVASGPRAKFVAPAHGLLAAADEGLGRFGDAAENYMISSRAADLDVLKAQYLVHAARTYDLAGEREKALEQLRLVVKEYGETALATEATIRLAELTKGAEPRAHEGT